MNKRILFYLLGILILGIVVGAAVTSNYTTYVGRAIKIGDGKWIDLNGQGIGSSTGTGYAENITCVSNCVGFGGTGSGNASYPINLSNNSQATRIFSENTTNLTVTYLSNGNVSINALTVKGDTGATGETGSGNASYPLFIGNATGILPNSSSPYSMLNRSNQLIFSQNTSNITVTKQVNDSYALDLALGAGGYKGYTVQSVFPCVMNIVYQNTNTTSLYINVIVYRAGASPSLILYTDSANPPTTMVGKFDPIGGVEYYITLSFMVLPNNYWKLSETSVSTTTTCIMYR